jgi:hypothetical protein
MLVSLAGVNIVYVQIDLDVRRMPVAEESGVEVPYNHRSSVKGKVSTVF